MFTAACDIQHMAVSSPLDSSMQVGALSVSFVAKSFAASFFTTDVIFCGAAFKQQHAHVFFRGQAATGTPHLVFSFRYCSCWPESR